MTEDSDDAEATTTVEEPEPTDFPGSPSAEVDQRDDESADDTFERAIDSAAESFVNLERQLHPGQADGPVRGRAVDVERIDAAEVPETYPISIASNEALAMQVRTDDESAGEAVVYFEWPPDHPDGPLARLLSLRDIPREQFADLHGQPISLRVEDGFYVPDVPTEAPRGSKQGYYGVLAGLGANVGVGVLAVLGLAGLLPAFPLTVLLLLVNFVLLPVATYLDGWYLRTHTDWDQGPIFWASLAFIPGLNVFTLLAYLATRRSADSI